MRPFAYLAAALALLSLACGSAGEVHVVAPATPPPVNERVGVAGLRLDGSLAVLGNGLDLVNGIDLSGVGEGAGVYAPPAGSALEQWLDESPDARRAVLAALVECALPADATVRLVYRGVSAPMRGLSNLGPSLQRGPLTADEQESVSACLLAQASARGDKLSLLLTGPFKGFDASTPAQLLGHRTMETAFFGNLFLAQPKAYVCAPYTMTASRFRGCGEGSGNTGKCGLLSYTGDPLKVRTGAGTALMVNVDELAPCTGSRAVGGLACLVSAPSKGYYLSHCTRDGKVWPHVMTVRR